MDKKETNKISVGIPIKLHEKMKKLSIEYGINLNTLIDFAIMNFLDQKDDLDLAELYRKVKGEEDKSGM
jgi:predicted DNA-binding protein